MVAGLWVGWLLLVAAHGEGIKTATSIMAEAAAFVKSVLRIPGNLVRRATLFGFELVVGRGFEVGVFGGKSEEIGLTEFEDD